jgi:DNA-binding XRE family transcriptional regulator
MRLPDRIARTMSHRRDRLGISQACLARMVGLSTQTVRRFFAGHHGAASFETACKLAHVLGLSITVEETVTAEQIIARQATQRARHLAAMVQGTSSLEARGLSAPQLAVVEQQLMRDLLKGSRSRLWDE